VDEDMFEGDIMMDPEELERLKREWNNTMKFDL